MDNSIKECTMCERDSSTHKIINSSKYSKLLCARCRDRLSRYGEQYEIPSKGEVKTVSSGKIVCHVCGYAFNKPLAHAWQVHGMSEVEYKKEFGLDSIKGIMSESSTALARQRNIENQELVVNQNLLYKGSNTRFKKGSKGRTKDKVREQTKKRLLEHIKTI